MYEYIKREAAYALSKKICDAIRNREYNPATFGRLILDWIDDLPAADVAPVRHGRWIQADEQPYFRKKYHPKACSECHRRCGNPHYEFCPWCGAKIDKEEE